MQYSLSFSNGTSWFFNEAFSIFHDRTRVRNFGNRNIAIDEILKRIVSEIFSFDGVQIGIFEMPDRVYVRCEENLFTSEAMRRTPGTEKLFHPTADATKGTKRVPTSDWATFLPTRNLDAPNVFRCICDTTDKFLSVGSTSDEN